MSDATLPLENTGSEPESAPSPRPRTRWAGIVWGLVFAGLAVAGIWLSSANDRLDDLIDGVQDLDLGTTIGYGLLVVGALALITGLVALLRRAQLTLAARRASEEAKPQEHL